MRFKGIFEYSGSYLERFASRYIDNDWKHLKPKDCDCYSCGKQFDFGDIIFYRFHTGSMTHIFRHLACAIQKNVITQKEAVNLAPDNLKSKVRDICKGKFKAESILMTS